jgi:tetratricopeptide (TPR) repeat protein
MNRLAPALVAVALALSCAHAVKIHPQAVEHNTFGVQYLEQGDLDKAEHRFQLALEYNPDYPEPYNNLCLVWIKRGKLDKAKDMCVKALRLNNDFAEAYNNLGYIHQQEKSYGKAEDDYRSALKVNPGYLEARYNLCLTLLRLKKVDEARVCYDKVIEVNANLADPYHDLCELDLGAGRLDSAVRQCQRAVELDPKFANAWFHLGLAYQGSGKHCEALEAYKSCIGASPDHAECLNNRATAQAQCALTSAAVREAKAEAQSENSAPGLYALGAAELDKGLLPDAERHFRRCLKLDGRYGPCYCKLAALTRQRAATDEAKAFCRKCRSYATDEQSALERQMCEKLLRAE